MIEVNRIKHGCFIKYEDVYFGILCYQRHLDLFNVYWYNDSLWAPPSHIQESTNLTYQPVQGWSATDWANDENLQEISPPLQTKEELEMWKMVNPGHDAAIDCIYKDILR